MRGVVIALALLMPSVAHAARWPMLCTDFLDVWARQIEADGDPVTKPGNWVFENKGWDAESYSFSVGITGLTGALNCRSKYVDNIDIQLRYSDETVAEKNKSARFGTSLSATVINTITDRTYNSCVDFAKYMVTSAYAEMKLRLDRGEEGPTVSLRRSLYYENGVSDFYDGPYLDVSIANTAVEKFIWFRVIPPNIFKNSN